MSNGIIPPSYDAWHHCITVECGLKLTEAYINERIAALQDNKDHRTKQFIQLYGQAHWQNVLGWFVEAQKNL